MAKILLIEDEPISRKLVTVCLSQYEVATAETLAEAREQLKKQKFDLILLDLQLPDGDGFSFLSELQSGPAGGQARVILLTAKSLPSDKAKGLALGADDYVVKPFDPTAFKTQIEAQLQRRSE